MAESAKLATAAAALGEAEVYTRERKAEFLLNNAVTPEEYAWARQEAKRLGVDPDTIPHQPIS